MRRSVSLCAALILSLSLALPVRAYDGAGPGRPQTLSGGGAESFAVDGSGRLWAWGDNSWGQLGGSADTYVCLEFDGTGVRSVSAGEDHAYAVLEDNTLWAWGRDMSGSFAGLPVEGYSASPVKLMDDVASASTGVCTHLAVKTDGSLWAWGRYVGDRTNRQRTSPVKIMDNVAAACTGFGHSLALKTDGSLWAWGQNTDGGVGDGTTRERPTPVKVMTGVVQMTAGYGFSAAVKADGTLWTWGRNWQGELGDGSTESRSTPAKIMDHVVSVYAANNTAYALRDDGSLWAWGSNRYGEVGDGTAENRLSPVRVLEDAAQVGAGWNHVLVKRTDGSLWTWGGNAGGQLGNGESGFFGNYQARFSAFPIQAAANLDCDNGLPQFTPWLPGRSPDAWAAAGVDQAIALGFLPVSLRAGYDQPITRAEFCALAVQFYETFTGQEIARRATFPDTASPSVEKAAGLGIVSGMDGGLFGPDVPMNREQAAVILSSLARALDAPLPSAGPDFADSGAISPWALAAAGQVQNAGIMSGSTDRFSPQDAYTKEQSIVTIMNLYRFLSEKQPQDGSSEAY